MSKSGQLLATAQQSRFWTETLDTSHEIDLKDVTVSIGDRELISPSHLRIKDGIRYALIGRNGSGKSSLLTAIAQKLIPGLSPSLRILALSQIEDAAAATAQTTSLSVVQYVVQGDKERLANLELVDRLTKAVEAASLEDTQRMVNEVKRDQRYYELVEARKVALRRSGARGKAARGEEISAEAALKEAEETLDSPAQATADAAHEAATMLSGAQIELELLDPATTEARAAKILKGLGFSQAVMDGPYLSLSGGWRSRCSLAIILLVHADLLILDEPTNFLDLKATIWLQLFLSQRQGTLIVTSHDQDFLDAVAEETIILRFGTLRYFEGAPTAFEVTERRERLHKLRSQAAMDKRKDHIQQSIQKGAASARKTGDDNRQKMVKTRQKKLDERWGLEKSAKGGRFKLNRDLGGYYLTARAEIEIEAEEKAMRLTLPEAPTLRTAGALLHLDDVGFRHKKAATPLLSGVTLTIQPGGRYAFVGANGQGKSTLAKLMTGELTPTAGTITRHPLLTIGTFGQHAVEELTLLPRTTTALSHFRETLAQLEPSEQEARSCLGSFGLQGKTVTDTSVVDLSGGQKVRLALALLLYRPPPMLLLDEVTTHVDVSTIRALAVALKAFSGAIVLVTHDRWFSRVIVEGESAKLPSDKVDDDEESSDSEEDVDGGSEPGITYRVGGGKVTRIGGMDEYVRKAEAAANKAMKATSTC